MKLGSQHIFRTLGILGVAATLTLTGCGDSSENTATAPTTATYLVTVTNATSGVYKHADDSDLSIEGLNFSKFAFVTHQTEGVMWQAGEVPPAGIVHVAEWGRVDAAGVANGDESLDELSTRLIDEGMAYSAALTSGGTPSGQTTTFNIQVSSSFPLVSFAGMVAPSADFFTGGYDVPLFIEGAFESEKTVNLFAYSAESRDDADLIVVRSSSENPAVEGLTNPVVFVADSTRVLSAVKSQLASTKVLGTVTFTKQ